MKKEEFNEITERLNRIEILLINQQFTTPKIDTSAIKQIEEWAEENSKYQNEYATQQLLLIKCVRLDDLKKFINTL